MPERPADKGQEQTTADSGNSTPTDLDQITSPMVGTFFSSPGPEADPFVYEGKRVERGEIICIIEAMKLMNEIEAEQSGIIKKILVKDSEPVEFGQPLFLVESA
jgi:acetyl-CoA carboxylase biotin carboxyl carrier protein